MPVILGGNTGIYLASLTPSVDADAQAFITAAAITDPTQQTAINTLVVDLKGYSIWTKMKAVYPFVGSTASQHKWNLKDPRDLDAAFRLVFSGGWTHSANGALPNGTNGYADTFFIPSNNGLTSSSGHLSIYSRSNIAEDRHDIGGVSGGIENMIASRYTANLFYVNYGAQTYPNVSNNDSKGHFITNRNSTTNTTGFKNGIRVINTAQTGGATTIKLFIGARNNQGSPNVYSSKENAFASIGTGLTDAEAANFYTAVQAYQTTLSRQV